MEEVHNVGLAILGDDLHGRILGDKELDDDLVLFE